MRVHEYRAWDKEENRFWYFTLREILERRMSYRGSWDEKILVGEKTEFTGLFDKNNNKIYEGDIIYNKSLDKRYVVGFKNGAFTLSYENSNVYLIYDLIIEDNKVVNYKIIGNVYEEDINE